jgi:hypothetical protein
MIWWKLQMLVWLGSVLDTRMSAYFEEDFLGIDVS